MHTVWGDSSISSEGKISSEDKGSSSGPVDESEEKRTAFVQRLDGYMLRTDEAHRNRKGQLLQAIRTKEGSVDMQQQLSAELGKKSHRANALVSFLDDTGRDLDDADEDEDEEGEDDEEQNQQHPGVWSAGSLHHDHGQCRPCHFISTKSGCSNGTDCNFCHLNHPKPAKLKQRPCKSKRIMLKRLANTVNGKTLKNDPDKFAATVKQLVSSGEYTTSLAQAKLKEITEPELVRAMGRLDLEWVMQSSSSSKLSL
eukprot:TRINITY_DN10195_c0_g1_i2.p1 TRINITY_DN10195_c0_g1~~TRINITY_DN10195_c0_g1_i2.p1  ORF type:complete len:255 (+),score=39.42 TRINITY_DN10195_c0_g1_i2:87-851(+)